MTIYKKIFSLITIGLLTNTFLKQKYEPTMFKVLKVYKFQSCGKECECVAGGTSKSFAWSRSIRRTPPSPAVERHQLEISTNEECRGWLSCWGALGQPHRGLGGESNTWLIFNRDGTCLLNLKKNKNKDQMFDICMANTSLVHFIGADLKHRCQEDS